MPHPEAAPLLRLLRVGFVTALVLAYILALRPVPELMHEVMTADKLVHAAAFCGMSLLGLLAWPHASGRIVLLMLVYGVAMEIGQSFVPLRSGDPADWVADAIGTLCAWLLYHRLPALPGARR